MNSKLFRTSAFALAVCMAETTVTEGQVTPPVEAGAQPAPAAQNSAQPAFRQEEIDQMTASIALYPDALLAQVLMASTYPLEVVQAERWVKEPANAALQGDQLAAALEQQKWDPSVKSLVPFPQVLQMMSEKIDWTQRLGDAFLGQQADVMASIQRLRREARNAGNLKSTEQQTVVVEPASTGSSQAPQQQPVTTATETIVIQPASPDVVYVPSYNPSTAYGTWPYPSYPPAYYPPPPAYYPGYYPGAALASGIAFGVGVAAVGSLWGWGDCNWGGNNVSINASRYNTINANNIRAGRATQLPASGNTWRHDPSHRGGVGYRDAASRQAFNRQARPAAASRDFRGYADGQGRAAQRTAGQRSATGQQRAVGQNGATRQRSAGERAAGQRTAGQGSSRSPTSTAGQRRAGADRAGARQNVQPSAFQGMGNGSQVRANSARGQASRQSLGASRPAGGGGASRAAGGGGGRRGGGRR